MPFQMLLSLNLILYNDLDPKELTIKLFFHSFEKELGIFIICEIRIDGTKLLIGSSNPNFLCSFLYK